MTCSGSIYPRQTASFNGAAAFQQRKFTGNEFASPESIEASMGPLPFSSGNGTPRKLLPSKDLFYRLREVRV